MIAVSRNGRTTVSTAMKIHLGINLKYRERERERERGGGGGGCSTSISVTLCTVESRLTYTSQLSVFFFIFG